MTLSLSPERAEAVKINLARKKNERVRHTFEQKDPDTGIVQFYTSGIMTGAGNAPMAAQLRPRKRR